MENKLFYRKKNNSVVEDEVLKVTALIYLEEALINEAYEEVPELIENVKKFGAKPREIRRLISKHVRNSSTQSQPKVVRRF